MLACQCTGALGVATLLDLMLHALMRLDRWLPGSGAALPVIGLVLMLAAWWSASDTPYVADQIPMLISGGLVGLGLLLVGVGLFLRYSLTRLFRFWLARVIVEQQTQNERVLAALDGIETAIRESRLGR